MNAVESVASRRALKGFKSSCQKKDKGMDVILTDHHLPNETLPPVHTLINPNQGNCPSGLGHLCGAGVAYYLFLALKMEFTKRGNPTGQVDSKEILDCFIIGTLTDMVPLKDENRVLVRHGLKQLEKTKRPGLRALMRALDLENRSLTSSDVGIKLAPKLNALSRMDKGLRPIDIFVEEDEKRALALVEQVLQNNEERKDLQNLAMDRAFEQAALQKGNPFVWVYSTDFHRGVIGLVATRLVQDLGIPAFVGSVDDSGIIHGSGRAPDGYHLLDAFEACSKVLTRSGGHAQAAGFELRLSDAEEFGSLLKNIYSSNSGAKDRTKLYDVEVKLEEINVNAMSWMEYLEPFGQGFETPVMKISELEIKSFKTLKGGHLKMELAHPNSQYRMAALYFSPPPGLADRLKIGQIVDVLTEAQWNYFAGRRSLQLILQGLRSN
jgi:single-stranded-DNA-specific exonuclease